MEDIFTRLNWFQLFIRGRLLLKSRGKKGFCFIAALVIPFHYSVAQYHNGHISSPQLTPPSHETTAMAKYAAVPVGYYTGVPDISLPLFSFQGKDISLPIGLRYHPSGDESWVGKGWSVTATGVISRVINGIDDFGNNGYIGSNLPASFNAATVPYLNQALQGETDTGPDLFYFNFMGYTGKFMFSPAGELVADPNNKLHIEPLEDEMDEWVIRDPMGYQYIFGGPSAVEQVGFAVTERWAVTGWYLKKVISPLGEIMEFHYHSDTEIFTDSDLQKVVDLDNVYTDLTELPRTPRHHYVPYLNYITIDKGSYSLKVSFSSSTLPSNKRVLNDITLVKSDGTYSVLKKFSLYHENNGDLLLTGIRNFSRTSDRPVSSTELLYSDGYISGINFSSGKAVQYAFEPHTYNNNPAEFDAGVRIGSMTTDDENANIITTDFVYGSGKCFVNPVTAFDTERWHEGWEQPYSKYTGQVSANYIFPAFGTDLGGPAVGYGSVSVETSHQGKQLYTFENQPYMPVTISREGYYKESLFTPLFGMDFRNGKLKRTEIFKLEAGQWKSIQYTNYLYEVQSRPALKGINIAAIDAGDNRNITSAISEISAATGQSIGYQDVSGMQVYSVPTSWSRLSTVERIYTGENEVDHKTVSSYDYANDVYVSAETTTLADGIKEKTVSAYPFDYEGKAVYDEMVARHMLAFPVEVRKEQLTDGTWEIEAGAVTAYGFFQDQDPTDDEASQVNEHILPVATYQWEQVPAGTTPASEIPSLSNLNYTLDAGFSYNTDGNLVETTRDRHTSATIWSADHIPPVAVVANASASEVFYNGFEEAGSTTKAKTGLKSLEGGTYTIPFTPPNGKDYILSYWYYQDKAWHYREKPFVASINEGTALDEVRVYPVDAQMVTFGYDKFGNKVSQTDANNISTYYDYNNLNQVTTLRNDDRDIVRTIEHNYSYTPPCEEEENPPITASFVGGDKITMDVDQTYQIAVTATGGCGDLNYNWYLIDKREHERYLGKTTTNSIDLKAPCSEVFIIKCRVEDERKTNIATIRKYGKVNLASVDLAVDINRAGEIEDFLYCPGIQINLSAQVSGSCGGYSFHWEYTYYPLSGGVATLEESGVSTSFPYNGRGDVTCTVTDGLGYSTTRSVSVRPKKECR